MTLKNIAEMLIQQEEIHKLELQEIEARYQAEIELYGYASMKWMLEYCDLSCEKKLKRCLLFPFRNELERGIVVYADVAGKWKTHKKLFHNWMIRNSDRIDWSL